MKECDRLSLVSYDTQVYVDFSLTAMDKASKERTKISVEKLQDGSCTNLCGGLMKGGAGGGRGIGECWRRVGKGRVGAGKHCAGRAEGRE